MNEHDDLEAYVLGALEPHDLTAFETHLSACSECRAGAASYGGVMRALRVLPVFAPPASSPRKLLRPRGAWIAAIAAAAAVGIVVGQRIGTDPANADLSAIAAMVADRPREVALVGKSVRGTAIVGAAGRRTAFVLEGLPAPAPGRGYQVWLRGARVTSPGMLHRTSTGLEVLVVTGDVLAGAHHIGISIEPAGGSPARTGPPQATGEMSEARRLQRA